MWRASANINAIACSAVVIEMQNGVFITMMPFAVAAGMSSIVDADAVAGNHLQPLRARQKFGGDLRH